MTSARTLARLGALLFLLGAAAACDDGPTSSVPTPGPDVRVARLDCTVTVADGRMACQGATPSTGDAPGLIVGGQGTYVFLQATNHTVNSSDNVFSIDVTVQNLLGQALGTTDGTTLDAGGVKVLFDQEPYPAGGDLGETVTLLGVQRDFLMRADQAYHQYDEILAPNQTSSALTWDFGLPPAVTSFRFVVWVMAQVPHPQGYITLTPPADTLLQGATAALTGTVRNAFGDALAGQPITWGTSNGAVATVGAGGLVTAVAPGTATLTATSGTRTGSTTIAVCPNLSVGGVYTADMPASASLCLGSGEYVVMPVNASTVASTSLGVTGAGIVAVSGAPTPALLPGGAALRGPSTRLVRDDAWETRLRQRERTTLPRTIIRGGGSSAGPRRAITPGVPAVGALMTLNVETDNACSTSDNRTGRVAAVGTRIIILADTLNPSGGLTSGDYQALADSFDNVIYPAITGVFGAPGDIDGNGGRVIAFYTRAVNEMTPPGSSSYIGGFVFARDLFPAAGCPPSNVGEMFYMLAADPAGVVNGNVRGTEFVKSQTLGTLAHEFEHLINASRRMWVNTPWNGQFEETWLDEGLAHVSEELMFYARSGLSAGGNIGVADIGDGATKEASFFRYQGSNFNRLRQWLLSPHANGAFDEGDDLATRGAAWAFLRYASDRSPSTDAAFFSALLNTGNRGMANVQAVLGTDPLPWYRDFVAAMYGDDAGIGAVAPYTNPSWNFRDLYTALDYTGDGMAEGYQLAVRDPSNGVTEGFTLASGGGAAYLRMGVSAGAFAGVTVQSGGGAPASTVRMTVIRRK